MEKDKNMKNGKKILMFLVNDAVTQHGGYDADIYDPGRTTLHVYSADSPEWENILNYYLNAFPDVDDFFAEDKISLLADCGWSVLKVGYDKNSDHYVAMLCNQLNKVNTEYRIIWFDGSHDQFLIRAGQIKYFSRTTAEYFEIA